MPSKSATFKEAESLRDELSAAQRRRKPKDAPPSPTAEPSEDLAKPSANEPAGAPARNDAASRNQPSDDIGELVSEAARFLEEREGDLAAHPVAVAIGGFVVGLIIGRLLSRRNGGGA